MWRNVTVVDALRPVEVPQASSVPTAKPVIQVTEYSTQHLQISLICAQSSEEGTRGIPVNSGAWFQIHFGVIAQKCLAVAANVTHQQTRI